MPANWDAYNGTPGGESANEAKWVPSMCTFSGGEAHFTAAGIDSCGLQYYGSPQKYGAWFARLKTDVEPSGELFSNIFLLWPTSNDWPPEIDIYEDHGGRASTTANVYDTVGSTCGSSPSAQCLAPYAQGNSSTGGVSNDDTQWHTYGVEWTPSGISWLIDGNVVYTASASQAKSPATQPAETMGMDLQSQNLQGTSGASSEEETMTVDWVEQFSWNG
jgi:beta-glucanase (GH16 family)